MHSASDTDCTVRICQVLQISFFKVEGKCCSLMGASGTGIIARAERGDQRQTQTIGGPRSTATLTVTTSI